MVKLTNIFRRNSYKNRKFYSKLINQNDLCFDIGANKGEKSKLFLNIGAKVIAFEPQSSCHTYLKQIHHKNFEYLPIAVGANNETKELHLANHIEVATLSNEFIAYFKNDSLFWNGLEKVNVKKLDDLIKQYGIPDFCKIDVEGYELEILTNLNHTLPLIEFEFTGGFISNTIKIIELLNQSNTVYNFNLNEQPKFELNHWISNTKMISIVKNLSTDRLHGNIFVKNL